MEETYDLFRLTLRYLESCADILDNTEWGTVQWKNPEEEKACHTIYELCKRYRAGYDFLHGGYPEEQSMLPSSFGAGHPPGLER